MSTSVTGEAAPAATPPKAKPAGVRADEAETIVRELLQVNGALAAQNSLLEAKVAEQEKELEPARRLAPAYAEAIDNLNNMPRRYPLPRWIRIWWDNNLNRRDRMSGGHGEKHGPAEKHGGDDHAPKKGGDNHGGGGGGKLNASTIIILALIVLALLVGYGLQSGAPSVPVAPVVADPIPGSAYDPTPAAVPGPQVDVSAIINEESGASAAPVASNNALSEFLAFCAAHNGTIYTADEWNKLGKEPFLTESGQLQCDY